MEAMFLPKLSVPIYQSTSGHIPEDCNPMFTSMKTSDLKYYL